MYIILGHGDVRCAASQRRADDARCSRRSRSTAPNPGYLAAHHYNQIFTAHGVIMIFFVAMPLVAGLMNYRRARCRSARATCRSRILNNVSFWMTAAGGGDHDDDEPVRRRIMRSTGWLAMPPLSGIGCRKPRRGGRLLHLGVAGRGHRDPAFRRQSHSRRSSSMRAPGMTHDEDADLLLDGACAPTSLIVAAFPVLTAVLALLLSLDRYVGTAVLHQHGLGGNPMMYVNLIWIWGHPEVYILILPDVRRLFSEVDRDLYAQAIVRLYVDGLCDGGDHYPSLSSLAASLLYNGVGREREFVLRASRR